MSFKSIMTKIGEDVKVVWSDVVKYLPAAESLAKLLFPAQAAVIGGVVNMTGLIQQAVATVEQKFAAQGSPTGTGEQKLAQVLAIVTPVVTETLAAAGLPTDTTYITNVVNAVVAILNVQQAVAA
jgi:hypothetical protein